MHHDSGRSRCPRSAKHVQYPLKRACNPVFSRCIYYKMMILPSQKNFGFSLHFIPAFPLFFKTVKITCPTMASNPSASSCYSESKSSQEYSRESSYDSTIHHRRTMSRSQSSSPTPPPPSLTGFPDFFYSRAAPVLVRESRESDAECWERMLMLQREYRCYRSARLEAAVEAMERGAGIEDVPIREYSSSRGRYT